MGRGDEALSPPSQRTRSKSPVKPRTAPTPRPRTQVMRRAGVVYIEPNDARAGPEDRFPCVPKDITSAILHQTQVPVKTLPRSYWLRHMNQVPPPWISCSSFVPLPIVEHLMRNKKNIDVKDKYIVGDNITNMEGAMHSFVTPIVLAWMHGEYVYHNKGHRVRVYEPQDGHQSAIQVLVSCMVQLDFQDGNVMMELASLKKERTTPPEENFTVPSTEEKRSVKVRTQYEDALRRWMVSHLTKSGELPSIQEASTSKDRPLTVYETLDFLETLLFSSDEDVLDAVEGVYIWLRDPTEHATGLPLLSLEVLMNSVYHQVRNEFDMLEKMCASVAYDYTFDPPVIFAHALQNIHLMPMIHALAIKHHVKTAELRRLRNFGYNNFAAEQHLELFTEALHDAHDVKVMSKNALLAIDPTSHDSIECVIVLHNNSDGFGQNIEYEGHAGSLDAAIGQFSSTAASLVRTRGDLLERLAVHG